LTFKATSLSCAIRLDLWSFLNNNKENLTSAGYDNTIIIMADGYLVFENNNHVIEQNNNFTGTEIFNSSHK